MSVEPVREPDPWGADDDYYRTTEVSVQDAVMNQDDFAKKAKELVCETWNRNLPAEAIYIMDPEDLVVMSVSETRLVWIVYLKTNMSDKPIWAVNRYLKDGAMVLRKYTVSYDEIFY